MTDTTRFAKRRIADDLEPHVRAAGQLARKLGLDPYPVNYWIVDHDEMNELIAYEGFQERYPHWRWGMNYDRQRKQRQFLGGKAFEIVNNDDPSHAFLQESNALADQKAVITHVEAHADFFRNNEWFRLFVDGGDDATPRGERGGPDAAAMLARHAETVREYVADPDIDREAVEAWIDHVACLDGCIDQHRPFRPTDAWEREAPEPEDPDETLAELDISEEVRDEVFDDAWFEAREASDEGPLAEKDLLAYLAVHGRAYDEESGKAVAYEEWQRELLELLRREAYYFAPQRMTKVMNEGWAAYWESLMMTGENFAADEEFVAYADHMARVLGSPGLNPYALGLELWTYVENRANREAVLEALLRVDGVTPETFRDRVDLDAVLAGLEPDPELADVPGHLDALDPDDPRVDADGLAAARAGEFDPERYPWRVLTRAGLVERHYSLVQPANRGFLKRAGRDDLDRISRYLFETDRYATVEEAVAAVDRGAGWDRLFEVRESHNDVTFLDEFLTPEFVAAGGYFAYEYSERHGDYRATATDAAAVKRKLLLRFTNFGKPTVTVHDGNFGNRNELLLAHHYNGVALDVPRAKRVLERVFRLWGRPVQLLTVVKEVDDHDVEVARRRGREPEPEEVGVRFRYDGERFERTEVPRSEWAPLASPTVGYDTTPDEWRRR
ncbi:SpoVR family protein [Halosegnis marinus]|uniref:SpoVR family protein n=1 Tax=Halosegnis marinus TaxID=3034023 RepID=A0ABD5ZSM7_9EURY|nr:SpoVR family protein [Halosegnis sp. DT85]